MRQSSFLPRNEQCTQTMWVCCGCFCLLLLFVVNAVFPPRGRVQPSCGRKRTRETHKILALSGVLPCRPVMLTRAGGRGGGILMITHTTVVMLSLAKHPTNAQLPGRHPCVASPKTVLPWVHFLGISGIAQRPYVHSAEQRRTPKRGSRATRNTEPHYYCTVTATLFLALVCAGTESRLFPFLSQPVYSDAYSYHSMIATSTSGCRSYGICFSFCVSKKNNHDETRRAVLRE